MGKKKLTEMMMFGVCMKRKGILLGIVAACMLTTAACSYRELEDGVREGVKESIEEIGENEEEMAENSTSGTEEIAGIGETIIWESVYKTTMEYTLESVDVIENLNESQIQKEDLANENLVREDGTFVMSDMSEETGNCVMLVVTLKVKNIDFQGYSPDAEEPLMIAEEGLVLGDELQGPLKTPFLYADYFSNYTAENREKDYFKYTLEPGAETEVAVGWVIPEEKLEGPLYYIIGLGTENYQYFCLNEGEDGI